MDRDFIQCTVDGCSVQIETTLPEMPDAGAAFRIGQAMGMADGVNFFTAQAMQEHFRKIEDRLESHLKTHSLAEWVGTITTRNNKIAEIEEINKDLVLRLEAHTCPPCKLVHVEDVDEDDDLT